MAAALVSRLRRGDDGPDPVRRRGGGGLLREGLRPGPGGSDHRGPRLRGGRGDGPALPRAERGPVLPLPDRGGGLATGLRQESASSPPREPPPGRQGDEDGVCRVESVDQENQGRAVRRALDHTLRETDLRTVRKEISRVAQAVAGAAFLRPVRPRAEPVAAPRPGGPDDPGRRPRRRAGRPDPSEPRGQDLPERRPERAGDAVRP